MATPKKRRMILYCKYCRGERVMDSVGEGLNGKVIWFRCSECNKIVYFKTEKLEELLQDEKPLQNEYVEYDPQKSFSVGQYLYHKVWNDKGEVLKKEITPSGKHTIVVSFDRLGEKKLIESLEG
jgi:hypothetical protein